MDSPIEKIIEWYSSLPIEHRVDVASMLGMFSPGFDKLSSKANDGANDVETITEDFLSMLENSKRDRHAEVGMALNLRSTIEFFFISKRKTKGGWKKTEKMLKKLARDTQSMRFIEAAEKIEFRGRQWMSSCEKWDSIRDYLTDDYLDLYFVS